MDPLTSTALVFIAKAAGGLGGYAVIAQGTRAARQLVRSALEDIGDPEQLDSRLQTLCEHIDNAALDLALAEWHRLNAAGVTSKQHAVLRELLINALTERRDLAYEIAENGDRFSARMAQPMIRDMDEIIRSLSNMR